MGDLLLWEARYSQREECNHQNNGGLTRFRSADYFAVSDGRPSSDNLEVLNRFGIEDMYALRRTSFRDNDQVKVDVFVKVILHDSNVEKFHKDQFFPGQEVLLNYNLTDNLI